MGNEAVTPGTAFSVVLRLVLLGLAYALVGALTGIACLAWSISQQESYSDPSGLGTLVGLMYALGTTVPLFVCAAPVAYLISQAGESFVSRWPNLVWMLFLIAFSFLVTVRMDARGERRSEAPPVHQFHFVFINQHDEVVPRVYWSRGGYGHDLTDGRMRTDANGYGSYSVAGHRYQDRAYYDDNTFSDVDRAIGAYGGHRDDFVEFSNSFAPRGLACGRDTVTKQQRLSPENPVEQRLRQRFLPRATGHDTFGVIRGWQFRPDDLARNELRFAYRLLPGANGDDVRHYVLALPATEGVQTHYPRDFKLEPGAPAAAPPFGISASCAKKSEHLTLCAVSVTAAGGVAPADAYMFRAPADGWQARIDYPEAYYGGYGNLPACGFFRTGEGESALYGAYAINQLDDRDLYVRVRLNTTGGPGLLAPAELSVYFYRWDEPQLVVSGEYRVAQIYKPALDEWLAERKKENRDFKVWAGANSNIFFPNDR
jgi:hypothetical protein